MLDISIIVISYNTKLLTKKCVQTILQSLSSLANRTTEIIVFDNASNDGSVEEIKNLQLRIKNKNVSLLVIESKENLGFAKANNEAVKRAQGEVILFLNSDIEVIENAVAKLYTYFTSADNSFEFVGGKLLEKDGFTPQPSCGPFYTLPVVFAALFLKGDYWGLTRYSPTSVKSVDWVSGACIMCKKNDFVKIGGFDENIFMYMDEIDLLYRAKKEKMTVGFYPDAKFIHIGSASSTSGRKQPILQVFKGFLYFYKKHYSSVSITLLKSMLQLKAQISLAIGTATGNTYLKQTYGEAQNILKNS